MREVVGYIRTFNPHNRGTIKIQGEFIERYCISKSMMLSKIFYDFSVERNRRATDEWKARLIGTDPAKSMNTFPGWDDMMVAAVRGEISIIVVDTILRLYNGEIQKEALERICKEHGVTILETQGTNLQSGNSLKKVAIYHYSLQKGRRTSIPLNDIDKSYEDVSHHSEWEAAALYLDVNAVRRKEYPRLKEDDGYDIVLVKSFYHIKRATMVFLRDVEHFKKNGAVIYSEEEGKLIYGDDVAKKWIDQPLKVAVYDRKRSEKEARDQEILMKRFRLFVKLRTGGWMIAEKFIDGINEKQTELKRLIENASDYDVVLVDTFVKIGETVICLAQVLREIRIPIYSIREGVISLS